MRLREFCAFTQRFLPARGVRTSRPFRTDVEVIQGVSVGIASLCTAWLSGPETDGKGDIVLGARQVHDIADELDKHGAQLEFALLHHPLEWLDDSEAGEVRRLLRERFDVVLHGHLHQRDARVEDDGSNHIVSMGAGAAYDAHAGERWLGFFLGQLDDNVEIDAFTYTSQAGRWHPDASFGRAGETRRTLTFVPKQLTKRAATIESQPDVLAAQLRAVLARVHATLAFTGFPRTGVMAVRDPTRGFRRSTCVSIRAPFKFRVPTRRVCNKPAEAPCRLGPSGTHRGPRRSPAVENRHSASTWRSRQLRPTRGRCLCC